MSLFLRGAGVLYRKAYWAYEPLYSAFKAVQDRHVRRVIRTVLGPGQVAIDVGANVGVYTRFLASIVGEQGRVHAFEPDPENFGHLQTSVGALPHVVLNNCAIGNSEGTTNLHLSRDLGVDHRTYANDWSAGTRPVRMTTLDHYLERGGPVRLVKVDIQGFEVAAFTGMRNLLRDTRDIVVVAELWPFGLQAAGTSAREMTSLLLSHGLRVHLVTSHGLSPLSPDDAAALSTSPTAFWDVAALR